jgi:hypothetical protein
LSLQVFGRNQKSGGMCDSFLGEGGGRGQIRSISKACILKPLVNPSLLSRIPTHPSPMGGN